MNWGNKIEDYTIQIPDKRCKYHVFSFFEEKYIGAYSKDIQLKGIAPHDSSIVLLKKAEVHPQVLSTNMHFAQGAIELEGFKWDEKGKVLSIEVKHYFQRDSKIFLASNGFTPVRIETNSSRYSLDLFEETCPVIRFDGNRSGSTSFKISWMESPTKI